MCGARWSTSLKKQTLLEIINKQERLQNLRSAKSVDKVVGATSSEVFLVVALLVDKGRLLYSTRFADVDIFSTFFKSQTETKRHDATIMPRDV